MELPLYASPKWNKGMTVETIAEQFATEGAIAQVQVHGGGHINDSYRLQNRAPGYPDYLLQRVNHHVFEKLTGNMLQTFCCPWNHKPLKNSPVKHIDQKSGTK